MLHSTRRLLTEDLHPVERSALIGIVATRGGPADAEALSPRLLGDAAPQWDVLDAVVRCGGRVMAERLHARFVADGRLIKDADPQLLWAFGWAGLEHARSMLFHYAREREWDHEAPERDWEMAPAAIDGLVHLSPAGLEDEVRAAVEPCVGRSVFPEHLPALAGWIGDVDLVDRFLVRDHTSPSTDCMGGVLLAVGLLGPAGRRRLHELFWTDQYPMIWNDAPRETGVALRMTGLSVADLIAELRSRIATVEGMLPFWWFVIVRCMVAHEIAARDAPPRWRFLPAPESLLDLHRALAGPNGAWDEGVNHHAFHRLGPDGEWLAGELHDLERPLEQLIRRDALIAELCGPDGGGV